MALDASSLTADQIEVTHSDGFYEEDLCKGSGWYTGTKCIIDERFTLSEFIN